MLTTDKVRAAFAAAENGLSLVWDVLADYDDEYGDAVITDGDTVDALIEIAETLARLEAHRIADIKREYESIL